MLAGKRVSRFPILDYRGLTQLSSYHVDGMEVMSLLLFLNKFSRTFTLFTWQQVRSVHGTFQSTLSLPYYTVGSDATVTFLAQDIT